jgi:hypothetical protein
MADTSQANLPFGSSHPVDMLVDVRARLFVIAALLEGLNTCAEQQFAGDDVAERASALLDACEQETNALTVECSGAIGFLLDRKKAVEA